MALIAVYHLGQFCDVLKLRNLGITGMKRIGHSGTLDPFATGLLIVGVGREATKQLGQLQKLDKEYVATIRLGATSNTFDGTGVVIASAVTEIPTPTAVRKALQNFIGKSTQTPPIFSAKKVAGRKLYQLARKGIAVTPKAIAVEIFSSNILAYAWPHLTVRISCASGTYIRSFAHDLGQRLGCGGLVQELRRTKIGNFKVDSAVPLLGLTPQNWQDFLVQNIVQIA